MAEDIGRYLSERGVQISRMQEYLIFERFNKRQVQDRVNYAEFIEEVTPRMNLVSSAADYHDFSQQ